MIKEPLPQPIVQLANRIQEKLKTDCGLSLDINHALINEYTPGQGIMAHTDGSAYKPIVCTLTTGGAQVLNILSVDECGSRKCVKKVYLERRALNVLFDSAYDHLHEIEEIKSDRIDETIANIGLVKTSLHGKDIPRQKRTSFTLREVKNAIKKPKFLRF